MCNYVFLAQEEADVRLHVQEALSLMAVAYKELQGPNMQIMEVLIMSNIEKVGVYKGIVIWKCKFTLIGTVCKVLLIY